MDMDGWRKQLAGSRPTVQQVQEVAASGERSNTEGGTTDTDGWLEADG
jgi:hypothetical protein